VLVLKKTKGLPILIEFIVRVDVGVRNGWGWCAKMISLAMGPALERVIVNFFFSG